MTKKFFIKKSIFSQLLVSFVIAVLIPALAISTVSVWSSYQIGRQRTIDQLNSIADLKSAEIDMWTNNLNSNLYALINQKDLNEKVIPMLQNQVSPENKLETYNLFIDNMRYLVNVTGLFSDVSLLNIDGEVIASTNPAREGKDLSGSVLYQNGLQKDSITPPFIDSENQNKLMIVATHPIIVPGLGAVGVLAGYSDLSVLDGIMEGTKGLDLAGESYLVNPDQKPITFLKYQPEDGLGIIASLGIHSALETKIHGYSLYKNYAGIPVVGVHAWLPKLQIALIVEQPQKEAFGATLNMLNINLAVSFGAVILTIILAISLTRSFAGPLTTLSDTASKIAAGDLNSTAVVNRQDEIGILAHSFNEMTARLRGLIGQLQEELIEKARTEKALRESEEKFRYVFEYSIVGKSITLPNGEIHVNRTFADMIGYTQEELEQKSWQSISHPEDIESTQKIIDSIISGNLDSFRWEKRYLHKTGKIIWVDISSSLRRDSSGNPLYFITTLVDITSQKVASDEISRLNAELEQRVKERTSQLEEANKELEAFVYSVSHDLRSPLRAMDGFSNVLINDFQSQLDVNGIAYLKRIHEASTLMSQLIDDLLNLSRITRHEINHSMVNLSEMAEQISTTLIESNPSRHVEFKISPNLKVTGDDHLLRIALENLIHNAYKFSSKCDKSLIEIGVLKKSGEQVFFVKDNGTGFDMAYSDKLFKPFQRLHTPQQYPGTGIGLVTVQRIINRHGGRIWTEAAVDKGAIFYFTIGKNREESLTHKENP